MMTAGIATRRVNLRLIRPMGASRNGEKDLITFGRDSPRAALEALVSERNGVLTAPLGNIPFKSVRVSETFC
jgi:hypothetical protein